MIVNLTGFCQVDDRIAFMEQTKNWLKENRQKLGLSQDELATQLQVRGIDVSRATVSHWENGRYNIPLENVEVRQALANILRIEVKTLLKLAGYEVESKPHSDAAERAAWLIDQLPPEKQDLAVRLVEELAKT